MSGSRARYLEQLALDLASTTELVPVAKKYEPLTTSINDQDAKRLVDRHGLTGTLPKELSREQRKAAYEARYVSAGGHKAEKWNHRANVGDKVRSAGLAGATATGAGYLAGRTRVGAKLARATRKVPGAKKVTTARLADAGVAAATVGGAGELYTGYARRKRSSNASAPSGVAASALRRMRAYDPRS